MISGGATIGAGVADCHPSHKPGVALPPQKCGTAPNPKLTQPRQETLSPLHGQDIFYR